MSYLVYRVDGNERRVQLTEPEAVIGRAHEAQVHIRHDNAVSRVHCKVVKKAEGFFLQHCSSKNPTRLNGKPVVASDLLRLKDGDRIGLGSQEVQFFEAEEAKPSLIGRLVGLFGKG